MKNTLELSDELKAIIDTGATDFLVDITTEGKDRAREIFLMLAIQNYIVSELKDVMVDYLVRDAVRDFRKLCDLYANYLHAKRGVPGYKLHVNKSINKIILVTTPVITGPVTCASMEAAKKRGEK